LFLDSSRGGEGGGGGGGGSIRWDSTQKKLFASGGYLELALAKSKKAAWYSCCQPCHL